MTTEPHKLCAHGCIAGRLDERVKHLERRNRQPARENALLQMQVRENVTTAAREVLAEIGAEKKP